jgi:prepilin peptidase CpaA
MVLSVNAQHLLTSLPLLGLLGLAAMTDLRSRRVPNWLTATVVVAGFAQSVTRFGLTTPLESLEGLAIGFVLTFMMYAVGGRGAGDVKLMAGIGAWLGPWPVAWVFAAAAIVSLIVALVQSAAQGKLAALLKNTALMALNAIHVRRLGTQHVMETSRSVRSIDKPMPNAVNVLVATIAVLAWVARV